MDVEVFHTRGFKLECTVNEDACLVANNYELASVGEQAKIAYLVGNFKPTDKPSNAIYYAVYEDIYQGHWPVLTRDRECITAFMASAKKKNWGEEGRN